MSPELMAIRKGLSPGIAVNSQLIITIPARPRKQGQSLYVRCALVETQCGAENAELKRDKTDPVWSPGGMEFDCPTITKIQWSQWIKGLMLALSLATLFRDYL